MRVKTCPLSVKAAGTQDGTDDGVFDALVATYDLDSYGDRIVPGAFADTLAEWKSRGDPIPVIWSHMSFDPDAHIGVVEQAEERDEGLWVRGRLDIDQPTAAQVYRLLKGRRVTQFSFAYDVDEGGFIEAKDQAPYYELRKLKLYEVGPTLVGVNQDTELLSVKSASGHDVRLELRGASRAESDAVRLAVEAALGRKAGRVLSAKNEQALRGALDKITGGVADVQGVLAVLDTDTDDQGDAKHDRRLPERAPDSGREPPEPSPASSNDEHEAKPAPPAPVEEPRTAKTGQPAPPAPASLRLRADLTAFAAEVDSLTNEENPPWTASRGS
ncbi:HK97 family phage prohead protease [Pseudonocardia acaciae]|uniref:HK97 family phage prohead protease n=1 Tax=Pseudonocardia acaciae TaxID=551276 RepID=UPI0006851FD1|nr:HK97 family phage prohead protease [Pseudonocardia acaciae]